MKLLTIDTDEAQRLDITCKVKRTFDLEVNITQQSLTASTFKMDVCDVAGNAVLSFGQDDSLTVTDTKVRLLKNATDMDIASGVYSYDLIQTTGNTVNNLLFGNFIAQPSFTAL